MTDQYCYSTFNQTDVVKRDSQAWISDDGKPGENKNKNKKTLVLVK